MGANKGAGDGRQRRPSSPRVALRLYVAGHSSRSAQAIQTVIRVLREHMDDDFALEIIDVYRDMERARDDQIIGVPTLVRQLPAPHRRVVGDLSDVRRVLVALELPTAGESMQDSSG